ncbi:MAG TPA: 50S ribosomal protein L17 [bacterium]|nr:50S ribosomal protein L17 [bacterium]
MRHLKAGRALGIKPAHRRALMRNIVTSLLEQEQITTTLAKAKELRGPLDEMITLGKAGDLAARRHALAFVKSKQAMAKLFGDLAERYRKRAGGYSRILPLGTRRGDGALLARVLLVDGPDDPFAVKAKRAARPRGRGKAKPVLEEVAAEVKATPEASETAKPAAE